MTFPSRHIRRPGEFFFDMDEVDMGAVVQWLATLRDGVERERSQPSSSPRSR